jgi:alkanesulfonate monooxygenase SsuD/methylene tetrahydromethanopterin reductase-like flavin-dependent oxidoreductase (luciferase family)
MAADGKPAQAGLIPSLEDSVKQKTMIIGTPEEVAEGIQFYKDLLGMERLTLFPHLLGDPYEKANEQMARFMQDVLPLVN